VNVGSHSCSSYTSATSYLATLQPGILARPHGELSSTRLSIYQTCTSHVHDCPGAGAVARACLSVGRRGKPRLHQASTSPTHLPRLISLRLQRRSSLLPRPARLHCWWRLLEAAAARSTPPRLVTATMPRLHNYLTSSTYLCARIKTPSSQHSHAAIHSSVAYRRRSAKTSNH
jgi:hypothetical protein